MCIDTGNKFEEQTGVRKVPSIAFFASLRIPIFIPEKLPLLRKTEASQSMEIIPQTDKAPDLQSQELT